MSNLPINKNIQEITPHKTKERKLSESRLSQISQHFNSSDLSSLKMSSVFSCDSIFNISDKSKIKGIKFEKYSNRQEIVPNYISKILTYYNEGKDASNEKKIKCGLDYNKMKERNFFDHMRFNDNPCPGSYEPKYNYIQPNNRVYKFGKK
jgi:hypothetical protein